MSNDQLSPKEWAQAQKDHGALQRAIAQHGREKVLEAIEEGFRGGTTK